VTKTSSRSRPDAASRRFSSSGTVPARTANSPTTDAATSTNAPALKYHWRNNNPATNANGSALSGRTSTALWATSRSTSVNTENAKNQATVPATTTMSAQTTRPFLVRVSREASGMTDTTPTSKAVSKTTNRAPAPSAAPPPPAHPANMR
jgi:hypothetical protein